MRGNTFKELHSTAPSRCIDEFWREGILTTTIFKTLLFDSTVGGRLTLDKLMGGREAGFAATENALLLSIVFYGDPFRA
jgi:hypothetical protein